MICLMSLPADGQQHRVYGTPDGGAMVMGADTSSPLA